jgi:hypothetical protein
MIQCLSTKMTQVHFPDGLRCAMLLAGPAATVISFGKEYTLRRPTRPESWRSEPPPGHVRCIAGRESKHRKRVKRFKPVRPVEAAAFICSALGAVLRHECVRRASAKERGRREDGRPQVRHPHRAIALDEGERVNMGAVQNE